MSHVPTILLQMDPKLTPSLLICLLPNPASITFGKYGRSHPCNVAEMKIYGSLSPPTIAPSPSQSQQRSGASSTGSSTPRQTWPAAVSAGAANDPGLGLGNGVTDLPSRTDKGEGKWSLLFWGGLQNNSAFRSMLLPTRVRRPFGVQLWGLVSQPSRKHSI